MSVPNSLPDREALETFKQSHPERSSVHQIVALTEDEFVQTYVDTFNGDLHRARRVYQMATALQNQSALVWANLKDLVSPFANNRLFNTVPSSFLQHQETIPGYDRLFGNLDYIDCDPCRSVLSPAAYFVDLMRFVEAFITERNLDIPEMHRLENRRRDLFNLKLDCANTNDLIAYIDLVNETLETIVATSDNLDAEQILNHARFPGNLPHNMPLAEIRSYLSQLKLSLAEIYQTFETSPPTQSAAIARETLNLSPAEFELIHTELVAPADLRTFYGLDQTQSLSSLATVSTFLKKTGLNRQELNDLVFQNLDRDEVNAGLSWLFFINDVDDGLGWLSIEEGAREPNSFYQVPQEHLIGLSAAKLDRIYRFVKLARKLGWSFADLDWALRSLRSDQLPESALYFDGVSDFVTVPDATKLDLPSFTVEAWINPAHAKTNPILYKGDNIIVDRPQIHFLLGLDADNQLVFHTSVFSISGRTPIPLNVFTHIAIIVSNSEVKFYINGKPETTTQAQIAAITPVGTTLNIGADLGYEFFAGGIQELRIWQGVRSEGEIADNQYRRLMGQEPGLVAYWPLIEAASHLTQISDLATNPTHGNLGGATIQPKWMPQNLVLKPAAIALDQAAYAFNGVDQYLAVRESRGLAINAATGNQMTLEAWVNLTQNQGNTIFRIGTVNSTDAEFEFGVTQDQNLSIAARGTAQTSSGSNLQLNEWIHVAVVIQTTSENITQVQFYKNGQPIFLGSLSAPIAIADADLEIGRNLRGDYLNGQLREVRFWNRARTAAEIQQTMHQVLPMRAEGLIGYWRLNQIDAAMALDLSYNQNHLCLGGIPEDYMPDRIVLPNSLLPPTPIATPGTVLDLDGSNDVLVVSNPQNTGLGEYARLTLELWFKAANLEQRHAQRQIIYAQGDRNAGLNAYIFETRLFVIAWCQDSNEPVQETLLSSEPLSSNQWYHLAITHDQTQSLNSVEFRAYLDGNLLAFISSTHVNSANLPNDRKGYLLSRRGVAYLGGIAEPGVTRFQGLFNRDEQHYFAGQISDLRLWKRAKTAAEIDAERYAAPELTHPDLIAYLPMDEGAGEVTRDRADSVVRTSNGHTGILQQRNLIFRTDIVDVAGLTTLNSYYNPANGSALSWSNYAYTGRIYCSAQLNGAIGVSFYSQRVANGELDYRLRWQRTGNQLSVQLITYPSNQVLPSIAPAPTLALADLDRWYRFRIEVETNLTENRTDIRAKVWLEDTPEPPEVQWVVADAGRDRPSAGTVGIWTTSEPGKKWFDDLQVMSLFPATVTPSTVLLAESFETYAPDQNPSDWVDVGDRPINISPEVLLAQDFGHQDNQNPNDWQDTAGNYSRIVDNSLFTTAIEQGNNAVFRTVSAANNVHSHYATAAALNWSNYSYSGRLSFTDPGASLGVTCFSRYPDAQATANSYDSYYRLERVSPSGNLNAPVRFQLIARRNGASAVLQGTLTATLTLPPNTSINNTWYRFRIETENSGERTQIRAKVWLHDTQEPDNYQIEAFDHARERPSSGTVGLWAAGNGEKRFDDLRVERLAASPRLESVVDDRLFHVADAQDNLARWQTITDYPLLLRPLSRHALRLDGQRQYLTSGSVTPFNFDQFTISAWVNFTQAQVNPVLSWLDATTQQPFWFGITSQGRLILAGAAPSNTANLTAESANIPLGQFTHVAIVVKGQEITFYVNGESETLTLSSPISLNAISLDVGRNPTAYFAGQLLDLRLWRTALPAEQFSVNQRYQQPELTAADLVGYWDFAEFEGNLALDSSRQGNHLRLGGEVGARSPKVVGNASPNSAILSRSITLNKPMLTELASLRQLQTRHNNLAIDRLTALWFELRHTGREIKQTLFDRVFNGAGVQGDRWQYTQLIRWRVQEPQSQREVRSRLMGALQVTSEELDRLVQHLSGTATVIELNGQYLDRLYHLAQIPKVLRLTVPDFLLLLDLMRLTEVTTLTEFRQISDRADWLQRTGIQVSELEFLTHSTSTSQISALYTDAAIRDLATTLTNQSSQFLISRSSFVSDLVNLSQSIEIFDALAEPYQPPVNLPAISGLPTDPDLRSQIQAAIQAQVEDTLSRLQQEQSNAIVERLAELFQVEPERLRAAQDRLAVTPSVFRSWMQAVAEIDDRESLPADLKANLTNYLAQLSKALYLTNRFALTMDEAIALLQHPDYFSVTDIFNLTIADLEHLVTFTELKTAFNDVNGGLIRVFNQATPAAILELTNWNESQLVALTAYFGNASTAHHISELHRLYRAFAMAETLQVNVEFLIQLANTDDLTIEFYRQQAGALLNVLQSHYDEEQWQRVYKPIRDRLATQKRDALLSYALTRQLPDSFQGRQDTDLLSEYLLLDVQIGSEVETSRIAQGIAALQLYIQRCQLNLEQGVNPTTIPAEQWNWMKNYRVWEANRKVFLYPESYIEPELRDTKTPEFVELEQELMQGEINQASVDRAFNHYLNKFADLAELKIVGAYLHRDQGEEFLFRVFRFTQVNQLNNGLIAPALREGFARQSISLAENATIRGRDTEWTITHDTESYLVRRSFEDLIVLRLVNFSSEATLYLIGRTPAPPYRYYYRELLVDQDRWLPWKQINLAINAEFVTPAFAFNRLFLFWVEFSEFARQNRTLYRAQIQYSYLDFNDTWTTPQIYEEVANDLESNQRSRPEWQRVYVLQTRFEISQTDGSNNQTNAEQLIELRERLLVIYGDTNSNTNILATPLRNARERESLQLEFASGTSSLTGNLDIGLSLRFLGRLELFYGYMTLDWILALNQLADGTDDPEVLSRFLGVINRLHGKPVNRSYLTLTSIRVEKRSSHQWFVFDNSSNERYLIQQDGMQLKVYLFSNSVLGNLLPQLFDATTTVTLQLPIRLDTHENNQWLITDNGGQRFLIQPQRDAFHIYDFSHSFLYRTVTFESSISDYRLAQQPIRASEADFARNRLLASLPLEATLLDVNNQQGWYVLDTGEEQFLVRPDLQTKIATDSELLYFLGVGSTTNALSFSFASDRALQDSLLLPNVRFDRLDTSAARELGLTLFREGIDGLLSLESQQSRERNFADYNPMSFVIRPGSDNRSAASNGVDQIEFKGASGLYYQEIFFHIPFFIANQLNANQSFAESQRWYHYVFNPTAQISNTAANRTCAAFDHYWQYLPFHNVCADHIVDILNDQAALAEYRRDPFDPHAIAQVRINAYRKAIVMRYIDNLLDWGDYLFNQNNRESIGEAAQLYILAYNLLGPRPQGRANRKFEEIGDYNMIRRAFNNNPPDFLTEFSGNGALPVLQNGNILTSFCVTENTDFVSFWDRVSDRLFKIRHSLNIDGVFRQLDLFQPALDVRALVQAFAAGNRDFSSIIADINRPVPHYRYSYMLDKAKEMTEIVMGLGEKLLAAIQNRDAEQLTRLQNTHERNILELTTEALQSQITESQETLNALNYSKQNVQARYDYYNELLGKAVGFAGATADEVAGLTLRATAQSVRTIASTIKNLESVYALFKGYSGWVGPAPTYLYEMGFSDSVAASAEGALVVADILDGSAVGVETVGQFKLRKREWEHERTVANLNLQEIDRQIEVANLQLQRAEQELAIHNRTIQHNQEVADFHRRKFSNEQLYNWMVSRVSGLYFQAYKLAYATAKDAERAFQYEFGDHSSFINFGHWDSLRRGLLAGESLQLDLMRLEKYAIDQDSRYQEIEKNISLKNTTFFQNAFRDLQSTGSCTFNLSERLFDEDYPGHFFRIIKSIAISVKSPALQPEQTLNATLIQLGSQVLLEPNIDGVRYLLGAEGVTQPDATVLRSNWRANQQIAITRPNQDNGMFGNFDLNFLFDNRYFPFEGTGAISSWQLEMLQAQDFPADAFTNPNVDVTIRLRYTSRSDRGSFKQKVLSEVPTRRT